jgi:hypothetical protein
MDDSTRKDTPQDEAARFEQLFDKLADQSVTKDEFEQLSGLLAKSESLRLLFAERMSVEVGIAGWRNAHESVELLEVLADLPVEHAVDGELEPVLLRNETGRRFFSGSIARPWAYGLFAAVCMAIVAFSQDWWIIEDTGLPRLAASEERSSASDTPAGTAVAVVGDDRDVFIGRVRSLSDEAVWNPGDFLSDFLLRIEAGEQLALEKGLAEIELKSGVRLTLHGASSYTFTSGEQGVLNYGTISAHTNRSGYTTNFGGNAVHSLGDEASYVVVANGTNKVSVYDGEVSVTNQRRKRVTAPTLLGPGRVVYVSPAGKLTGTNDTPDQRGRQQAIARSTFKPPAGVLSLADIVSGGNGLGANLSGIVDAASGGFSWRTLRDEPLLSLPQGQFRRSQASLLIDGTFIASRNAEQLRISSAGHMASGVSSGGDSRGIIWARRPLPSGKLKQTPLAMMNEAQFESVSKRLKGSRDGAVGIAANSGITFDLVKAAEAESSPVMAFQASVRSVAAERQGPLELLVIVDGETRNTTASISGEQNDQKIRIPIAPADRYLTLFVTSRGNEAPEGQVVLFDPLLIHRDAERTP